MNNSKRGSLLTSFLFIFFASGCATSFYRVVNQREGQYELNVTSERIVMSCTKILEEDDLRYGFVIHVLDDEKTVLSVIQGNVLDKKSCFERIEKIGKMLKRGRVIYIGGMGNLSKARTQEKYMYAFPGIGKFHTNGRVLQFSVIANEFGDCFSAHFEEQKPCPRDEFPMRDEN